MTDFQDIEKLVAAGQKIGAIKEFRARTRVGLFEAKNAVEWFADRGHWPAQYGGNAASAQAVATAPPAAFAGSRAQIEAFMAQRKKIHAIKVLRQVTGWGLADSKRAVDHYQSEGSWSPQVLAQLDGGVIAPPEPAPPVVAPSPSPPSPSGDIVEPVSAALQQHLGSRPNLRLSASAYRGIDGGVLALLDDRACFVANHSGGWAVVFEFRYGEVTHAEVDTSFGVDLNITLGATRECFTKLDADEAQAALALFRVFAP